MSRFDDELKLALRREEPSPGFAERVLARLEAERPAHVLDFRQRWVQWPRLAALAVAAMILIALTLGLWLSLKRHDDNIRQPGEAEKRPPPGKPSETPPAPTPEPKEKPGILPGKAINPSSRRHQPHHIMAKNRKESTGGSDAVGMSLARIVIISSLDEEAASHLEKAQLLLRSFRNAPLLDGQPVADLIYERQLAQQLVSRNIVLRREAAAEGHQPLGKLLGNLEPFLLDIAHLPDGAAPDEARAIKERMQKKEIILALQLYSVRALNASF